MRSAHLGSNHAEDTKGQMASTIASQYVGRLQCRSATTRDELTGTATLGPADAVSAQAETLGECVNTVRTQLGSHACRGSGCHRASLLQL